MVHVDSELTGLSSFRGSPAQVILPFKDGFRLCLALARDVAETTRAGVMAVLYFACQNWPSFF